MKLWNETFREIVWKHQDKTAIVYEEKSMTYAELDALSEQVARSLRGKGIGRESIIAMMMERSIESIAVILGIWKAGAAYLCIDLSYPKERIDFMLKDCDVEVVIDDEYIRNLAQMELADLPRDIGPNDLAAVIYTSGSTGNPKGVMLEQKNIAMIYHDIADARYGCENDVFLMNSSTTFVGFLFTVLLSLGHGMEAHLSPDPVRKDITKLKKYIEDHKVTISFAPPQLAQFLIDDNSPLKKLIIGSDKAVPFDPKHVQVINLYGLTEVNGPATHYFCKNLVEEDTPIGTPMDSVKLYLLDDELKPVKKGEQGQICFAGSKLARGYLNNPEITNEKFIKNPFATNEQDKILFLSGDIGRELADGNIIYVNRNDWMVNINGFRVEPGEVENQIKKIPAIKNAVVKGFIDQDKQNYLCAFYTVQSSITGEEIKEKLAKFLPDYMMPSFFVELAEIPLNANGKVDRKSLPAPELSKTIREPYQAARNEKEETICKAFEQILGMEGVGINDNFFMLGGDSIKAMKLQLLCSKLGVTMTQIMQEKTPAKIAKVVADNNDTEEIIKIFEKKEYYPLTENQLGLYYEWEKDNEVLQYNLPQIIKLSNKVDPNKLKVAALKVMEAHPYLKTCLGRKEGQVVQLRKDEEPVTIEMVEAREADIQNLKKAFVKSFNLFQGPLYRMAIYYTEKHTYLFMDIHHIIVDGSTLGIFNADLAKAYNGEELEKEHYTAFEHALEEEEMVGKEKYQKAETFFDNKLKVTMTELPKMAKGGRKGQAEFVVIPVQGDGIRKFCQDNAVTPSNLFLSAFCYTLYRYTGEENIAITTISHGRNENKLMNIMGMFVKTLPLVVTIENRQNTLELIQSVQENMIETIENEIYPLTKMAEKHKFVPQINYVYQGGMAEPFILEDQWVEIEVLEVDKVKLPLAISIMPKKDSYEISIEYDESLYTKEYIQTLSAAIAECAKQIAEKPKTLCQNISIVNQEQIKLLETFNPAKDEQEDKTLQEIFEETAKAKGDHTALIAMDKTLSYAELNAAANKIANALIAKGIKPEDKVAFLLPRDSRLICTIFGIIKSGGAFIPVDPEYPEERIKHVLEDSDAKFIITTKEKQGELNFSNGLVVDELLQKEEEYNPRTEVKANNLCYIIYTSGSTGKPKGVMIEHRNIVNYVLPLPSNFYINKILATSSRMLSVTTVAFDVFLEEAFVTLANGLTMVFSDENTAYNSILLADFITKHGVDAMSTTPSRIMQYVEANHFAKALANVKVIICGGENFPANFFTTLRQHTEALIYNTYGPTETTIATNAKELENEKINIGKALSNVTLYVADKDLNLLPIGVVGELLIGGRGVGRGYLNRPELTEEKFILFQGERVYKSGDYAKWTADGEVDILGRVDNQIKLRGLRIELGEIESQIQSYEGIKSCAVVVQEISGTQHLCGYFTANNSMNIEELREHLAASLTEYMVPPFLVQLDNLPLTPNGKVDRKALPMPEIQSNTTYVAPRNETETIVAGVFETILGVQQVGIDDSFFALGGDSIKAIRMVSKLREKDVFVTVPMVMKGKTIRIICQTAVCHDTTPAINQEAVVGQVPLTFIQAGFFAYNLPRPHHFNQSMMLESAQRVEESLLRQVLQALAEHHDMLRAVYSLDGRQEIRGVDSQALYTLTTYEYQGDSQWQKAMEVSCNALQASIDLATGPMMKVGLFRTPSVDLVLIVVHHLVVDGVSWRILIEDINTSYRQAKEQGKITLPPKTTSFKEWSEAIGRYRSSYVLKQEIPYWQKVQEVLSAGCIPAAVTEENGFESISVELEEEQTRALVSSASVAYHTEVNDLLLCALCRAVHKVTGQGTVSINLEGHGREPIGEALLIDRTVGWFTTIYPVVFTEIGRDIRRDIRSVKETLRRVPNHGIGYGILQYIGESALDKGIQPDIAFNYLGELSEGHTAELFTVNNQASQGETIDKSNNFAAPIALNGFVKDKRLLIYMGYDKGKYSKEMVTQLGEVLAQELNAIVFHCVALEKVEITASDLGEIVWKDKEFEALLQQTQEKGWEIERIYPLTPMQEGMLFHRLAEPESTSYFLQSVLRMTSVLSKELLQKALYELGQKHEVFRTAILYKGLCEARQAILKGRAFEVSQVDISGYENKEEQLETIKRQDLERGFDLQEDPLLRVILVKMAEDSYCLVWSTHHIIVDGWCLAIVMRDFVAICNALMKGQDYVVDGETTKTYYEDYVRSLLAKDKEAAHTYWRNLLSEYTTNAKIHPVGNLEGGVEQEKTIKYEFSKEATEEIQHICSRYDITINTAVEAAWGLVLQKYNNTEDVVFGKVVSGRNTGIAGAEEMVGLFINTIPVRVQAEKGETLGSLLQKIQQQGIESTQYDFASLSEVQQLSAVGSDLIGTIMAFENYHKGESAGQEQGIDFMLETAREQTNYGISLVAYIGEALTIGISYHTNLYGKDEITHVLEGMAAVLTADPKVLCQDISIVNDEQLKILDSFNETKQEYSNSCGSIVEMFKQQVEKVPANIAVVYEGKQYTYQELDEITDKLAKTLKTLGVGAEQAVGVLIDRSEYMVIYPLAILKAGGAYMPLDYSFPTDRLDFMIKDAGVELILSEGNKVAEHIPDFGGRIIKTEELSSLEVDESIILPSPAPKDMFVILYTSGSTGMPKGCVLENRNLVNYCKWYQGYFAITEKDRSGAYANFAFDAHMNDIYPFITCGARVDIIPSSMRLDFIRLNQYFEENSITVSLLTTQLGMQFVQQFANKSLRALIVGGEKLLPTRKPSYGFYNAYGPTECTIMGTIYEIKSDYDSGVIGKPLDNYQLYVLDANLQLLPMGAIGELCIGGDGVGRGYLNREDITNEKFIQWQGKRIYRTGDLVRWTIAGEIEYLGRMDGQVKLRGLRIELGEIESHILSYTGITSCAVVVKEIGGAEHLCAYYTAEKEVEVEKLKEQMAMKLTAFMIPTAFTKLEKLPLTSNGKVNKKALPNPVIERQELVAAQNEVQQQLFDLVADMLGTKDFGIRDDLFSVGMTSILAIKIAVAIHNQFNVNITTNDIIKYKTIEKLEKIVRDTKQEEIKTAAKREFYPLTENQLGLYYEWEKDREALQYNIPTVFKLSNKVDQNTLKAAVKKVIEAHPYLKTYLGTKDGQIVQLRKDQDPMDIVCKKAREAEIGAVKGSFVQPFDLFAGPLYRIAIYHTESYTYLFMDIHHIIMDGSALGTFTADVVKAYQGEKLTQEHYTAFDHALAEEEMVGKEKYLAAEAFFDQRLQDGMTELPKVAKGEGEGQAKVVVLTIPSKEIETFCRENAVTPSNLFLSALCTTLSRYTREEQIAITAISSGRNENKLHNMMGMLVKTLPVVVAVQPSEKVVNYVKAVQENMFETMAHEIYPFTKMVEKHKIVPQINYAYQGGLVDGMELEGQAVETEGLALNKAKFPLSVAVNSKDEEYEISMEYDNSLYTETYIETLSCAVAECAKQMAENPMVLCQELSIVNDEEIKMLDSFNETKKEYSNSCGSIVEMFRQQVNKMPNNIAVVYEEKQYTYKELDAITDKLAKKLKTLGVGAEQAVGVLIDRSEYMVIYPLAILKAGGAYMPLDYSFPTDRLDFMIKDAGVELILSEGNKVAEHIPNFGGKIIKTEELSSLEVDESITLPIPAPTDMFVILYTSGSTGMPKGCILENRNLVNFCKWHQDYFAITEKDRVGAYANFAFDAHMNDIYPFITCGATVYIIPSSMRLDFIRINQYFEENSITVSMFTTQLGMQFVQQFDNKSLRALLVGGEKLLPTKKPSYDFYNGYGPTECTIMGTIYDIKTDYDSAIIGKPLANYQLYVLDANLQLLPIGAIGELCIGGDGVGRGYLNREDITNEKFIHWQGKRIYRTGDLVKWTIAGEIEYIGRMDGQVKLRGLRIELGEIESHILSYTGITSCAVVVKEIGGAEHLCAYYTADKEVEVEKLKEQMAMKLTAFMIPTAFTKLDKLPFTSNGKVNKKALPDPVIERQELVAAQNEVQQQLFDLVASMLGTEDFGITDDLFSVGMTSILAIKIAVAIHNQFNVNIKTNDIIKYKTIEKLAVIIKNAERAAEIKIATKQEFYPLTENQLGLYYEWEKDRAALQYNIPTVFKLSNKVEQNKLKAAVEKVIEAHPYLKTCLGRKDGQIVQLRKDQESISIVCKKVREAEIQVVKEDFVQPFDLFAGPLYRIAIYHTEKHTYLFIDIHHIIVDGSALGTFTADVVKAYQGEELTQERYTAFDYALEEAEMVGGERYLAAERFFDDCLQDGMTELPKTVKSEGGGQSDFAIVTLSGKEITTFCRENAVTPSNLFLSALCTTLSRYTREERIAITTTSSGRNENKLHNMMGMLVKTLPVVVAVQPSEKVVNYVKAVQENMFAAMANEIYPFTKMVEKHSIIPQINYAYQGGLVEGVELEGQAVETEVLALNKAKFPLAVGVGPKNEDYELSIEYDTNLYAKDYIETLSRAVAMCVKEMAEHPEENCGNLVLISKEDEQKLLGDFQGRSLDYDKNATFLNLFKTQVEKNGEKIAVVDEHSSLTYEQTDRYTDCLAKELVRLGVTENTFVGIMLPRRKEFMVSVVGTLKAGGAYVPLDNEYPQERIEYMLEDSKAKVLITEKSIYEQKGMEVENVIFIDEFDFSTKANQGIQLTAPTTENLAYMIYTSGSTGKPKGVMIRHKSLAALLAWHTSDYQLTEEDNLCCHSSFSFDASVEDLFAPLSVGGQLHIISEEIRKDMNGLQQYFHDHNITGGTFSTQFGMELLNQFDLPLRYIIMGGEKLKAVKKTNITMINGYGPTEFTICSSYHVVDQDKASGNIPIGKPVPNSWAYVVDTNNNLLPIGVAGELCLAGVQIALGYWGREDLTTEKFVDNPFKTCIENAKMYRTGDLVRWNENGELEYVGRIDTQVKLRGFRIELGEIESAMAKFAGITASVAEVKEIGKVQHLCGYFTANLEIDTNELKEYLKQSLTEYMVPTGFMQLDKIPLTPNGKVDKKALPALEIKNYNEYVAPTNELEAKLCNIFAETLSLEQVGIQDSFFDLGGTSLLAMKVVVKAMPMGIGLTYGNVFKYQTPQKLAEFLANKVKENVITDVGEYDYRAIDQLLLKNTLGDIAEAPMGDILLTGATGFLGIHILKEFLENYPGKVYCLIRSKDRSSADARLKVRLVYYFEKDYAELFGTRLFTVEGDINELVASNVKVDTVINCAALVKHFAAGDELEKVNVGGVQKLIAYCQEHNASLIQVSTTSVSGVGDATLKDSKITEAKLYLGQAVENKYIHSKFLAERYVLEAVNQGLKAKIMRVGNLMSRTADGEFQLNFKDNSFMGRLKAYKLLEKFPVSFMGAAAEFSPIDSTAKAILKLTQTNEEYTVFHPYNNHDIYMADIIYAMKEYGFTIDIVSDNEFGECLREKMQDDKIVSALTGLLAYQQNDTEKPIYGVGRSNEFTTEVLYRLNFKWPMTSEVYIEKAIEALDGLGFFDVKYQLE